MDVHGTILLIPGPAGQSETYNPTHPVDPKCGDFLKPRWPLPAARCDPLYAIPSSLLVAINTHVPGFMDVKEQKFEKELLELCQPRGAAGIVQGTFVNHPALRPKSASSLSPEALSVLCNKDDPAQVANIQVAFESALNRLADAQSADSAYLGWLLTNPDYQRELGIIRFHRDKMTPWRSFTLAPLETDDEMFRAFLNKWQLSSMASWELPILQGANLTGVAWPASAMSDKDMMHFSLPMTASVAVIRSLLDIVEDIRLHHVPPHLSTWIDVVLRRGDKFGLTRSEHLFKLYFFRACAFNRYQDRFQGRVEALDRAFGEFLGVGEDQAKKLRLIINRRMRRPPISASVPRSAAAPDTRAQ